MYHEAGCVCMFDELGGDCICAVRCKSCSCIPQIELPVARAPDEKIKSDGGSSGYYQLPAGAVEIQDLVEYRNMNFAVGNIFKAAYRMGQKAGNDELYEIRKIIWYANRELNRLTKQEKQ
jgi:hypothetical protein